MKVILEFETKDESGEVSVSTNTALLKLTKQGIQLSYVEDVSGEGSIIRNTMLVSERQMRVRRSGAIHSDFLYEQNMQCNTIYKTPYGAFPITLHTKQYQYKAFGINYERQTLEKDFRVQLLLDYTLSMNSDMPMKMEMNLKIRPA